MIIQDNEIGGFFGLSVLIGMVVGIVLGVAVISMLHKPFKNSIRIDHFKANKKYYIIQESLTEEEFKQKKLEILKGE